MPNRRPRPAVALLGSLLVTLGLFLAAELGIRLAGVQPHEFAAGAKPPGFAGMRVDPLLGPLAVPDWSGRWLGNFAVETDAHGFRSVGAPPHPGSKRVVMMGDSCSFGWGVDTQDTYAARIEARQAAQADAPFELLNAAYPGHSAVSGVYMLRDLVLPLDPDVVVLGFSANNAFRLATTSDAERFRWYGLRKLILRSRLFHVAAAWLSDRGGRRSGPRDRDAVQQTPLRELHRVAAADEFEASIRTMVGGARAAGAKVLFLIFPRASAVSTQYRFEDAASAVRFKPLSPYTPGEPPSPRQLGMLEASCIDIPREADPLRRLNEEAPQWFPVYPDGDLIHAALKRGALAYVAGDLPVALGGFDNAIVHQHASPLAHYDRAVTLLAAGQTTAGLAELGDADRLACNVFLHYQVLIWRVALELNVPVVDLTLWFQTHDGEPLFLDPAHPNAAGQAIIAEALWPALRSLTSPSPPASPPAS